MRIMLDDDLRKPLDPTRIFSTKSNERSQRPYRVFQNRISRLVGRERFQSPPTREQSYDRFQFQGNHDLSFPTRTGLRSIMASMLLWVNIA